jgi:polyhydroxyalkanoate synthase
MELDGLPVDLSTIRQSFLAIAAEADHIVPLAATRPQMELVGSADTAFLSLPGGHVGLAAGRHAKAGLWPRVADWLTSRSGDHVAPVAAAADRAAGRGGRRPRRRSRWPNTPSRSRTTSQWPPAGDRVRTAASVVSATRGVGVGRQCNNRSEALRACSGSGCGLKTRIGRVTRASPPHRAHGSAHVAQPGSLLKNPRGRREAG